MELLLPTVAGLDLLAATDWFLAEDIEVREFVEPALVDRPSCFVGDFVGDRSMLEGRLVAGLGLAEFMLDLLEVEESMTLILLPTRETMALDGRAGFLVAGFGDGAGCCSRIVTTEGRRNMPLPMAHSKYLSP